LNEPRTRSRGLNDLNGLNVSLYVLEHLEPLNLEPP